jgi:hypothetical protein
MGKRQAQELVKNTLQNDFDKERFLYFVKNLLNKVDDSKAFHAHGYVPEAFKSYVKTYERLATYTDPVGSKLDVLVVYLQKETSLERARTAQRNFIARYLKDRDQKDAGLIAFVSPDPANWRFSLVKMVYEFTEDKSGKTKVKEEFTPAKRWSFLVGKNENSHTAQSRLAPILEDDQTNPTLKQLEDAFNIEKITKEFFEKYRELFLRVYETLNDVIEQHHDIKADFAEKKVNTADFSKKLLGQIVFLYFLQKKGWFGVPMDKSWGDGDKKFLRTLFEESVNKDKNYFNDYLEPLFYEALAKERDEDFYSRFECKIPFLNGGLFDPISNYDWVNTFIDFPNDVFSNTRKTKDGDTGDGILDIFDRYNFTVKEDEPLEKEVAVDPEMLGKVFENLLEVKDRKSKGTYYTPREIVHYMCEQSLVNYLATELEGKVAKKDLEKLIKIGENVVEHEAVSVTKEDNPEYGGDYKRLLPDTLKKFASDIDDKLATIKVCDPAIGSGAFPVGMMNAIVKARMVLNSYLCHSRECGNPDPNRTLYTFKRDCIQNSLYGVDIDPGAVEIAKLRLWLSLVVDEDDIKQIKPLPNLDYKIMQGNSLLEEFEGIKLFDEKLIAVIDTGKEKLLESLEQKQAVLRKEYFELHSQNKLTPAKQAELNNELKKLHAQERKVNQPEKGNVENVGLFDIFSEAKKKADDLKRLHKDFFEATQKNKKDNIKKQIEQLEWELIEATLKEQGKTSALKKLEEFKRSNTKPFFLWKLNFADVFEEKGGFDVVIANPPYIDSESMVKNGQEGIREAILKTYKWTKGNWDIYIAFFELGFKEMNRNGTLTFITPDKWISKPFGSEFRKGTIDNIFSILKAGRKIFDDAKVDSIISFFANRKSNDIKIVNFENGEFIQKREVSKKSLPAPFAFDGLFSDSLDLISKIGISKSRLSDHCKSENACATSDAYKLVPLVKSLKDDRFDEKKYLKIINTGTIGKFYSKWGKREMTYLKHKYLYPVVDKRDFLNLFQNSYGTKSLVPKIIIKGLNLLDGCLDEDGTVIPGKTTLIIIDRNVNKLKFLLTIINSKLAFFYIKEKYPASSYNQGTSFTKDMINNLPIPEISDKDQKNLVSISEKIPPIATSDDYQKNKEKQAKVHDLEHQIDELVYKLYGLTDDEITIVESK